MAKKEHEETISVELTTEDMEDVTGGVAADQIAGDGDNYFTDGDFRATVQCSCDK
jgi:hypothetical protein